MAQLWAQVRASILDPVLRLEVIRNVSGFQHLKSDWQALAALCPDATPFQTWEWNQLWFHHFGALKTPLFLTVRHGDDLVGLFPLVKARALLWGTIKTMGNGPSDYLHPLLHPEFRSEALALFTDWIHSQNSGIVDLHQIRDVQPILGGSWSEDPIDQATCLVLELPPTYDGFLQLIGKSLRYDVRKLDKEVFATGKAKIEWSSAQTAPEFFEDFLRLHEMRWKKRGLPGAFFGRTKRFQQDWVKIAAQNGWLWLSRLMLDGKVVGSVYAMSMGEAVYFYQSGFDPEAGSISPGTLLVASTIRRAIEEGKSEFDFMRGDEGYKRRWKPQREHQNRRILFGKGLSGRLGMGWTRLAWRVECAIREKVEGKSLK